MHASDGWINSLCKRSSSHKDALVDPLSSKDFVVVADFHRFADCHPEAIFDVNKRRSFNYEYDLLSPSTGTTFVPPAIPLRTRFSAILVHTVTRNTV